MKNKILEKLNLKKPQLVGLIIAFLTIILSVIFLRSNKIFYFMLGIAFVIGALPFVIYIIIEGRGEKEKEMMFLEFAKNLVESVKAGTPISRSILNIRTKDYGSLNPHIDKLANQISIGIPIKSALETFARDVNNSTITKAVAIISESEKAGGKIDAILESVVKSVSQTEKLKKEREAAMYTLVVQGYIIYMIFIAIMLVMQFKVLPIASEIGSGGSLLSGGTGGISGIGLGIQTTGEIATAEQMARPFFYLLVIQGLFVGLVIGKIAEGKIKSGIKHSFILMILSVLISTGANAFA